MTRFDLRIASRMRPAARLLGRQVLAPGPNHSGKDRSLAIRPTAGGVLVHSHAGDGWRECQDHVARQLGLETHATSSNVIRLQSKRAFVLIASGKLD